MAELIDLMREATDERVDIYSARLRPSGSGFHLEVALDGLGDERGAVALADCEDFSHRIAGLLERTVQERDEGRDTPFVDVLPREFTAENYSLEVGSAGAERELRLPDELSRFRTQAIKLRVRTAERGVESWLVLYTGPDLQREGLTDETELLFERYVPKNKRARHRGKGQSKKAPAKGEEMRVRFGEIVRANLYLDF